MKKILITTLMLTVSTMLLFGCKEKEVTQEPAPAPPTQETVVQEPEKPAEQESSREDLLAIFPQDDTQRYYHGYAEFGYASKFAGESKNGTSDVLKYEGYMVDGEGDDPNDRTFVEEVEIAEDGTVTFKTEKSKSFGLYDSLHLRDSIIENQIILKLPLEQGTKWEQTFNFKGKELVAQNELVEVEGEKGSRTYKVQTVVKNVEDFLDNTYTETRVYQDGKGLVQFENRLPLSIFSSDAPGLTQEDYSFAYSLVEAQ